MNLYELTQQAIGQYDTYRHPNLDDWITKIDDILSALGESTIGNDSIESLYLTDDTLEIRTSYSVRCCECSNDMSIPIEILEDDHPLKKAKQIYITKELNSAKSDVVVAKAALARAYEKLEKTQQIYEGEIQ